MIKLKEYAGINVMAANGQVTMGTKGDASFFGPDAKMKGGVKRSVYKVPKSSVHSNDDEDNDNNLTPAFYDEEEEDTGKTSYVADRSVPRDSIHNQKFNETAGFPDTTPQGSVGDASFIGKFGMNKGNSRKPIFKTPKSSIHYKKGRFPDGADFYNDDNWETDAAGPSTDVSGKRIYAGNKSTPKNSIHYDEIPDEDRHYISTQEQLGIPMSADGAIDGGPRSMDPVVGKKSKKKKFADASKYGYPKEGKQMENIIREDNGQLLQTIKADLNRFNPGNHYMKDDDVNVESDRVSIGFRDLGRWIDDVQDGQDEYEDNDWRIWAPGEYDKYFKIFQKWASNKTWYNQVKLKINTSEKDWSEFSVQVGNKNEGKNLANENYDDNQDTFMVAWSENEKLKKEIEQNEEKDYDTNIVPKTSIHYGERDKVKGHPKMRFEKTIQKESGFVPDAIKNLETQEDWKSNLSKAVMDLTGEAEPQEPVIPVPVVGIGDTSEFPYRSEVDGNMIYPIPGMNMTAQRAGDDWSFGDTAQLPSTEEPEDTGCAMGHGEPSTGEIDIPCTQKPMIKKLMMLIRKEQKNLHEGIALKGLYEGKVVKLNTIFEGEHRRFKTFVKTNEGNIMKVHFGPALNEDCGKMSKKTVEEDRMRYPTFIDDANGKRLYKKFVKGIEKYPGKKEGGYQVWSAKELMKVSGMTFEEFRELSTGYGDSNYDPDEKTGWKMRIYCPDYQIQLKTYNVEN